MIHALAFYVFAAVGVISAAMVISARNTVHSVLFLILAFFNASALFILLGAEFLAMMLIVVYVGAVAVMFLFVVMMLDISSAELRQGFLRYLPVGGLIGLVLLCEVLLVVFGGTSAGVPASESATAISGGVSNTRALGQVIYTQHVLLFQLSGIILLIAMIGSIVLTHRRRPGVRRQDVARQVARSGRSSIEVRKVESGKGAEC